MDVVATDIRPDAEARLRQFVSDAWPTLTRLGLSPHASTERLTFETDLGRTCEGVDFVQENAIEREEVKVPLLAAIDGVVGPEVIIASSSSALTATVMQRECRHPERVIIGHPFNPPHLMPLVEVAGGERTAGETVDRALAFYSSLGKTAVKLDKEIYGHIANRLQAAVFKEALYLFQSGVAGIDAIDKALTDGPGIRWALMGQFLTYNLAGGDDGMNAFMTQFAGMQERLWGELGDPDLASSERQAVVDAMAAALRGRSNQDIAAERDQRILALLEERAGKPRVGAAN